LQQRNKNRRGDIRVQYRILNAPPASELSYDQGNPRLINPCAA
jgi:hypothetical protein